MQRLKIKHACLAILAIVLYTSCTTEPNSFDFSIKIINGSNQSFVMELYSIGDLYQSNTVKPEGSYTCTYYAEFFYGFSGCNQSNTRSIDSIIIRFENDKGYTCIDRNSGEVNQNCIPKKSFFIENEQTFSKIGATDYEFLITQEDFENAFELPE